MADDLEKIKGRRTVARRWMTIATNKLVEVIAKKDADNVELSAAVEDFDKRMTQFDECQELYEVELVDEEALDADLTEAAALREEHREVRLKAERLMRKLNESTESIPESASSRSAHVKLPKIELMKFSGDIMEWQSFWENFQSNVDSQDMEDCDKFSYLQSVLEGDAKKTIEGLAKTSKNYAVAWELLLDRYGRREKIVHAHVVALLAIAGREPKAKTTSDLRSLYVEIMKHIRSLDSLDVTASQSGLVLTPILLECLPRDMRMEWAKEEKKEGDLDYLLNLFKTELERRERSDSYRIHSSVKQDSAKSEQRKQGQSKKTPGSAAALQSQSQTQTQGPVCAFCTKGHKTDKCSDLLNLSVSQRFDALRSVGICFKCLKGGSGSKHNYRGCRTVCKHCKGTHNSILCHKSSGTSPKVDNVSETKESGVSLTSCSTKQAVFQLAKVDVVTGHGRSVQATVLFDNGSDRTYITSGLVNKVKPTYVTSQKIGYAPFGGRQVKPCQRNVYNLVTRSRSSSVGNVAFDAIEVPVICTPLHRCAISKDMFSNCIVPLSDLAYDIDCDEAPSVDILIGLDNYWNLLGTQCKKLDSGIALQDSVYGWLLSGVVKSNVVCNVAIAHQLLNLGDFSEVSLRSMWDLESVGIRDDHIECQSNDCLTDFESSVGMHDGRYVVTLPWKKDAPELLNNEHLARARLRALTRRLDRDTSLRDRYDAALHEMEDNHIIEEVHDTSSPYPVYCLPHRPVVKESIVYCHESSTCA